MDVIVFEKQEGSLCAQHALNALLQGSYFTAPDLAEIAKRLDAEEHRVLNPSAISDQAQAPSQNMDDSGFFSVQVLGEALKIWNLELVPLRNSTCPEAALAQTDPTLATAYICNFREHWFTIRKFSTNHWFNLNSMFAKPELVSNTFLSLLLKQLENDGYSIFVIRGDLPPCPADEVLPFVDVEQLAASQQQAENLAQKSSSSSHQQQPINATRLSVDEDEMRRALSQSQAELDAEDASLQRALEQSRNEAGFDLSTSMTRGVEDGELQRAIALSLLNTNSAQEEMAASELFSASSQPIESSQTSSQGFTTGPTSKVNNPSAPLTTEQIRERRLKFLENTANQTEPNPKGDGDT